MTESYTSWRQQRGCTRKRVYRDGGRAKRFAAFRTWIGQPTRAYRCDVCPHWHLTTKAVGR